MNVVLLGMKHCGKSTLGAALAARWQCPFHDVDPMIEATYECDAGQRLTVREILDAHGEARFRDIEGQVVCELYLSLSQPGSSSVISLGGGTALNERIRTLLGGIGRLVYLDVAPGELFERIRRAGFPPFLRGGSPFERFMSIYRERQPIYSSAADIVIDLRGLPIADAVEAVARRLEEHRDAGQ